MGRKGTVLEAPEGYTFGATLTVDQLEIGQHFLSDTGHHYTLRVVEAGIYRCPAVAVPGEYLEPGLEQGFANAATAHLLVPVNLIWSREEALTEIQKILDAREWCGNEDLLEIAQILRDAGYRVRNLWDLEPDDFDGLIPRLLTDLEGGGD